MLSLYRTRTASPLTLLWRSDDQWTLYENGIAVSAQLEGIAFVQTWLVILPLRPINSRRLRHIPLFPDELPEPAFRRLRVRLRMHQAERTDGDKLRS